MALPSTNFEQGQKLIEHVKQMTDVVNRLLFKTEQIATQGIDSIRVRQEEMSVKLGDLVAAAEIFVDEAGSEQAERVVDDEGESPVVERLTAIENVLTEMADPIMDISDAVKVLASAEKEDAERRQEEFKKITSLFAEKLDLEDMIAQLLAVEGYTSIEKIANASIQDIEKIEGFDNELAAEIYARATQYMENEKAELEKLIPVSYTHLTLPTSDLV